MTDFGNKLPEESDGLIFKPPPSITTELFLKWRTPRLGSSNPQLMNNPVWSWLVNSRIDAFKTNEYFNGPDSMDAGPVWCFNRFGQSSIELADGRILFIAGEHEDHYDPDFFIYNDVVVKHPDGRLDLYGYPFEVFPSTDFHSATLVDNRIVIIGNLGYPEQRRSGITPVFVLNLETFAISAVETSGVPPGWIHSHEAHLSENSSSIIIRRGLLQTEGVAGTFVENVDDWQLHLEDWRWEKLTQRKWSQWVVLRSDGQRNHIWEIQQAAFSESVSWVEEFERQMQELEQTLGSRPDVGQLQKLFCPPISYEEIVKKDGEYNVFKIKCDGVLIRYILDTNSIKLIIEGELPQTSFDALTSDLVKKLSALEQNDFVVKKI